MSTRASKRSKTEQPKVDIAPETLPVVDELDESHEETMGVSEYERVRNENIRRNQEFLSTLGLENKPISTASSARPTPVSRRGTDSAKKKLPMMPTRRSGRMTVDKLRAEVDELEGDEKIGKQQLLEEMLAKQKAGTYEVESLPASSWSSWDSRARIEESEFSLFPAANQPADADASNWVRPMIDAFAQEGTESTVSSKKGDHKTLKKEPKGEAPKIVAQEYAKRMSRLSVSDNEVAKVTESRITAVWIHPAIDKILIGAGDKGGNLGIWDVNSTTSGNGGVFKFTPHVGGITKLHAYDSDPSKLYSVSSDGTIRFLDLGKEAFVLGFTAPEGLNDISFNDASFCSSGNTVYIGKTDGTVGLVDFRSKGANTYEWCFETQPTKINSVQEYPTDTNLIITAGSGAAGAISIHDIRKAGKKWSPIKTLNEHTKSINAAYSSPDGRYMVSVGQDSTIRTWKNFTSAKEDAVWTATRHDNHTGR